ncbi:hypothetical protein [Paludibacterium purpuratum]|uniref:Uncharacterized protein n=1 Tax=Paludibacterium purpuratum TaxID=1144873 RepID=A0A4R7BBE5_9NEIS|nr:hypothetical protein [Paludibacterium purpuratum]TDR82201.1 hypothetical protein DFP86_102315 [Paludibacterium purpuratum]
MSDQIKLMAPENCDSFNFGGQEYDVSDDGTVDVSAGAVKDLLSHGFTVSTSQDTPPAKGKRGQKAAAKPADVPADASTEGSQDTPPATDSAGS